MHVATAAHESKVQLNYAADGLSPYWALRQVIHRLDGGVSGVQLELAGEQWDASLGYQESGLEPRPSDDVETLHEYRFALSGDGERKANFLIRPRWDDPRTDGTAMLSSGGDPVSIPSSLAGAVNVYVQGSNIELSAYPRLLARGLAALADERGLDWNARYFDENPHGTSNIVAHERYVRVHRDRSRALVSMDGPLWNLRRLLGDQQGVRLETVVDNREIVGKLHQVRLNRRAANELLPNPQRGKQLKHYHPRHVRGDADGEDPLAHPKFGALFSKSLDDGRTVPWDERGDLVRELEANVVNVLGWAGLPVAPDPTTYVADAHFEPEPSSRDVDLVNDPTPEIEAEQDATLIGMFRELTNSDKAALEELATDGAKDVDELAGATGYAARTIYRVLDRLDGLLEQADDGIQFVGEKLRQDVEEILSAADRHAERLVDRLAGVAELANEETAAKAGRAFQRWLAKWGVEYDDQRRGRLEIRIGAVADTLKGTDYPHVVTIVERGLDAWVRAGRERDRFMEAIVEWESAYSGEQTRVVGHLLRDDRLAP